MTFSVTTDALPALPFGRTAASQPPTMNIGASRADGMRRVNFM